jgi:hypothetical protein
MGMIRQFHVPAAVLSRKEAAVLVESKDELNHDASVVQTIMK